jgi:cell division protein FtsI (penicillin-binding protein 3)
VVVIVDEPNGEMYYGGQVAAPVFSAVVAGALRILAIPPDHFPRADVPDATLTASIR